MSDAELALVNKVELRIALAGDDKQFEAALKLYLTPVLLKLSSPHAEVRKAVLKIIQHLIPRISAAREIKLPVESLLEQVKDPKVPTNSDPASVRLYSLLFISRSIDRLSDEEKRLLVPKVIENISTYPSNVSARLFNVLCKLLESWKSPERDSVAYNNMNEFLGFTAHPDDETYLCSKFAKFLLLQANGGPPVQSPGLSVNDCAYFTQEAGVSYKTPKEIFEVKVNILRFLKAGFKDTNLAIPLLTASVDSSSSIRDPSEILFRKLKVDIDSEEHINKLVDLFIGSNETPLVNTALQDRIMQIFMKSKVAAAHLEISHISSVGLESDYTRLKQNTVHFIKWVSSQNEVMKVSQNKALLEFNISMTGQLRNNLLSEGWPKMDISSLTNYSASLNQRILQYEALGNILRTNPDLFLNDLSFIEFLFESLEGEIPDLRSTIQDSLSSLTVHLPQLSKESKIRLKELTRRFLVRHDHSKENLHSCRYVSIKFINCAYPFEDPEARYLCLLGTAKENRADTIEEAIRGLHPHWFNILQSSNTLEFKSTGDLLGENSEVSFPSFQSFVILLNSEIKSLKDVADATIFHALSKSIQFALQILVMQAVRGKNTVVVADEDWSIRLEKALEVDSTVQNFLKEEIVSVATVDVDMNIPNSEFNSFMQFLMIIYETLIGTTSSVVKIPSDITYFNTFTMLVSLSPPEIVGNLQPTIEGLFGLLDGKVLNDISLAKISQAFGIISTHSVMDDNSVLALLEKLSPQNVASYLLPGRLLVTSYVISRLSLRQRIGILPTEFLVNYCELLLKHITDPSLYSIVLECISQLSIFGVLGPTINHSLRPQLESFMEAIKPKVKKCDEKSVLTFAFLTLALENKVVDVNGDGISANEILVYETHISKQIEFTFSSGEAFLVITGGWQSKYLARHLDIQGESVAYIPEDISRLEPILNLILKSCANTKPSLRKSGCIWLLSLIQYCGHLKLIKDRAPEIHVSFMRFLADRDELVQESASRGLSLVYELGDHDLKDTLVRGLLKSFTDSNSAAKLTAGSIENDTELFEPDLLKTNDGSVSTYKDVLSLASEVGDSSLVYKFMSLAKSSALWSSRKGIAFGLGSILSKSSLDELLSTNKSLANRLIPKLFRYKYDPTTSVHTSMNEIWNALVKDTSKTVNDNFTIILEELLKSMGNKEWRVRQASTAGLNDLLQIVPLETYENRMEEIWNMSFRVMDDIKESVRKEGTKLTKSLATTLTKTIDIKAGGSKAKATQVLDNLIPFLLGNKGLLSDSEDVKNFALETILKLCKVGGEAIKQFVPKLIDKFINLMSTLEPEVINYLILNADKYNIKNNDIDAKRLQSLGQSPMMDAIEKLMNLLDDSIMDEFITKLESSIKRSIGLPSKVCGSRVLVLLITKHFELAKPYGDKLLRISIQQFNDKNDTIASSYATAAGYLCRISSIPTIINYSMHINKFYFESEDDRSREISSIASECVSKYSGDKFEMVASAFLPLAFIGKYDSNKIVKANFEKEWIENTSGNNTSIKLYLNEILEFFRKYINSNKFEVRKILGKSISNISNLIDNLNHLSPDLIKEIIEMLIESNKGKSWEGKELLLESLVSFSIKAKEYLDQNPDLQGRIDRVVIVEAKRRNKEYQKHAVKYLGLYLNKFPNSDLVEVYMEVMNLVLSDKYYKIDEDDDSDDSDDEDKMEIDLKSKVNAKLNVELEDKRLTFIKNLTDSFYVEGSEYNHEFLKFILNKLYQVFHSKLIENTWRSKLAICEHINLLVNNHLKDKHIDEEEVNLIFKNWQQLKDRCLNLDNIENVRIQFIRLSNTLIVLFNSLNEVDKSKVLYSALQEYEKLELSSVVKMELSKVEI